MISDVAVIGAGAFGGWTALHLQRAGLRTTLADAYSPGNARASSGGESRIIRMGYGADEIYTRSAMRALYLWRDFQEQTGERIFHPTGVLWTADEGNVYAADTRQTLARCGARFEIMAAAEMRARYPQMCFNAGASGIYEPESGALMARRATAAVAAEASRSGAEFLHCAAAPLAGAGKIERIGEIRAGTFVFACGPWLPTLFPDLLGKRITPTRQEAFFFGAPAGDSRFSWPQLPVWIDFSDVRGPYGFPDLENRGVKIALDRHGPAISPDRADRMPSPSAAAEARECLAERFPDLRDAPIVEARVCQYENTSNGDFLIDRHPDFENVWLAGGGSGHGFKHGPAVGEYLAARIQGQGTEEPRYTLATKSETRARTVY